jgi:N-acetylglucosamine-6-phosphate deacetylase
VLLRNATLVTPAGVIEEGWVRIDSGRIADLGVGGTSADAVDLGGRWLGPGFIDAHIHGAGGSDVMEGDPSAIAAMAELLVHHGVTSFVPTTYTADTCTTLRALGAIEAERTRPSSGGAQILGAHLEGPFLSTERAGAHRIDLLRPVDPPELEAYFRAARVLIIAVAPEVAGNAAHITPLAARGVVVSIGHTDARYEEMVDAVDAGAVLITHLFNGMRPMHHREAGALGAALLLPELVCELIADGTHVDPQSMKLAWLAKGADGIVLVSDAGRDAGSSGRPAMYTEAGVLASSVHLLDEGFRRFCAANSLGPAEAWPTVSGNIARVLGLRAKGTLEVGADADLTVLDADGSVAGTIVAGEFVYCTW